MKTFLTASLILLISLSAFATDIDGNWVGNMKGPDGNGMDITFVFKMDGEKLTGVVKSLNGDVAISNTKINGKEFSFEVSFNEMTIKHTGILNEDDTITLKIVGSPMGDSEMSLKRQK